MKKLMIIETGGTIAGSGNSPFSSVYKAGEKSLKNSIDKFDFKDIEFTYKTVSTIDSSDISYEIMIEIGKTIELNRDKFDGFIITHGTDTIKESAYYLNLVAKTSNPIVFTCAMRVPTMLSSDGEINLYDAITVAKCDQAKHQGVMIVSNNIIHSARDVDKCNTIRVDAFKHGVLGSVYFGKIEFLYKTVKLHTINSEFTYSDLHTDSVSIAYIHVGAMLNIKQDSKSIILACYGNGTYPKNLDIELKNLYDNGVILVKCSKVQSGSIYSNNNMFISSGSLDIERTKILLNLMLNKGYKSSHIEKKLNNY